MRSSYYLPYVFMKIKNMHKKQYLDAMKNFAFSLVATVTTCAHAGIIKCTDADGRVFYSTHIDAIKLAQRTDIKCEGLTDKFAENKREKLSYQDFLKNNSKIKGINAVKLSDLHSYIDENISTESKESLDLWVKTFPPFIDGVAIQYPTVSRNTDAGWTVEVAAPSCGSGARDGMLFEKEEYKDTYVGQNAYGARAKVREEAIIQYCLTDLHVDRAKFILPKSFKVSKNNLAIIGRGRIDARIKDERFSHEPTFSAPLDRTSAMHRFEIHAAEYLLVDKRTGKTLETQSANP